MSIVDSQKLTSLKADDDVIINRHIDNIRYAVVSFVSPEDALQRRFVFDANHFLHQDVNTQLNDMALNAVKLVNASAESKFQEKINLLASSANKDDKALSKMLAEIKSECLLDEEHCSSKILRQYAVDAQELLDRFEAFRLRNQKSLDAEFQQKVTKQTSVRGFKIRGAYDNLADARKRAQYVRDNIEPNIHAYVAPVGHWVPWDPNPDAVQDQEYALEELNELVSQYNENAVKRQEFYNQRKQMMVDKAKQDSNTSLKESIKRRGDKKPS